MLKILHARPTGILMTEAPCLRLSIDRDRAKAGVVLLVKTAAHHAGDASRRPPRPQSPSGKLRRGSKEFFKMTIGVRVPPSQPGSAVLFVHDADLRAADVDPRTGLDALRDHASFPVRIEITDAFHTPAGGFATPAD